MIVGRHVPWPHPLTPSPAGRGHGEATVGLSPHFFPKHKKTLRILKFMLRK